MRYILLFLTLIFLGCGKGSSTRVEKRAIIPVYFYDLDEWSEINNYSKEIVIINPSNGPGRVVDENYKEFIKSLVKHNNIPIGYIYTKWGNRNLKDVKNDIDKWLSLYPDIKGFFVDEVNGSYEKLAYYKTLKNYVLDYYLFLNPGKIPDKNYFSLADGVIVFEGDVKDLDKNICNQSSNSAIVVYGATLEDMKNIVNYKCKYFYITDDTLPSPYDTLPTYFDKEIELLK